MTEVEFKNIGDLISISLQLKNHVRRLQANSSNKNVIHWSDLARFSELTRIEDFIDYEISDEKTISLYLQVELSPTQMRVTCDARSIHSGQQDVIKTFAEDVPINLASSGSELSHILNQFFSFESKDYLG